MTEPLFDELMHIFSVPRPNGSRGERETIQRMQAWLDRQGIPFQLQPFTLYPYYFELLGIWLVLAYPILAIAVFFRTGWWVTLIAALALLGSAFSFVTKIHFVTWPGRTTGYNFLIQFGPEKAEREVVLSAHYDSKSEPLDHHQRMFFLKSLQGGLILSGVIAILAPLDIWLLERGSTWAGAAYGLSIALSLAVVLLASGYGLNLALGRLAPQSSGAVDNGTACAILMALADRLEHGAPIPPGLRVTLAVFGGEEVDRQGSRAYVRSRAWLLPLCVLNLEVMAQNGDYVFWERDGTVLRLRPTDSHINAALKTAVEAVSGAPPRPVGPVLSDGGAFIEAGLPAAVLGTYDRDWVDTGFHSPADNLDRVARDRLPEGVEILYRFIKQCHDAPSARAGPSGTEVQT